MTSPFGSNAPVPYLAPWVANWNKYSTQILPMSKLPGHTAIKVPASTWYRPIYITADLDTSSVVADRVARLVVATGSLPDALILAAPAVTPASTAAVLTYGINLNTFAVPIAGGAQYLTMALVDMLWPPGTNFDVSFDNNQVGDFLVGTPVMAVEIYTEFTSDNTAPVLIPSPVLT